jgi:hypothetical protein
MNFERELGKKELSILDKRLNQINAIRRRQINMLIGWTTLGIIVATYFYFQHDFKTEHYAMIFIYVMIGFWSFFEIFISQNKERKNINFVKSENKVSIIKVISKEYIEFSEEEDEGVYYLFQLDNNKILSFGGQDFYPNKKFPSNNFEVAVCYGKQNEIVLLETYNYGDKLLPLIKITGEKKSKLMNSKKYPNPDTFTIIDGQLDKIDNILV